MKTEKHTNTKKLTNILLNNEWVTNEIKKEVNRYLETNENKKAMTKKQWDMEKAVLRDKLIAT